ncbi:hypothetical protein L596_030110 [Steinernema carpocapsae]|uniref:CS domain-containing protein n=1 Tax=Steinernema carpocapsae TaxID=34508 RepID=A0A4U5LRR2_STECR|nr:hypothetical protein L596_030110 [Steinernema carpocapsae]
MITPSFSICQDGQFLTIKIHAPYANVGEADVEYYEKTFVFTAEPYFLRLFLPCEVIFDESGACDYDADSGHFTVKVPKKNEDEHFPNLDMLQDLLKAPQISAKPVVEEIEDDEGEEDEDDVPKVPDASNSGAFTLSFGSHFVPKMAKNSTPTRSSAKPKKSQKWPKSTNAATASAVATSRGLRQI